MDIVEATRVMVNDYMSRLDPSHDMYHVERVRRLALYLADQDDLKGKVDLQVIELAALCHDIGDRKYAADHEDQKCVYAFLARHGYPKAELVQRIVDHVGFRKELGWNDMQDEPEQVRWRNECLELHAVQDADKLDAIGAFGVMRCAAYSGAKSIPLHVPGLDPISGMMTKEQYETQTVNKTGCAVNHFYEKLFRLSSMMRTKRGRTMAEERDRFMREFVARIEKEYEMQL